MAEQKECFDLHLWIRRRDEGVMTPQERRQIINHMVERIKAALEKRDDVG